MCNQYVVVSQGTRLDCSSERMEMDTTFNSQFAASAAIHSNDGLFGFGARGFGQVTAVTTDLAQQNIYFFHRSTNE